MDKFPESKEKDLLKIVGNLIYYKYMNPVIISPDRSAFIIRHKCCGHGGGGVRLYCMKALIFTKN